MNRVETQNTPGCNYCNQGCVSELLSGLLVRAMHAHDHACP